MYSFSCRLRKINGIFVYGEPEVSVVGFGSDDFDILLWEMNSLKKDGILTHFNFLLGMKIILSKVSNLE